MVNLRFKSFKDFKTNQQKLKHQKRFENSLKEFEKLQKEYQYYLTVADAQEVRDILWVVFCKNKGYNIGVCLILLLIFVSINIPYFKQNSGDGMMLLMSAFVSASTLYYLQIKFAENEQDVAPKKISTLKRKLNRKYNELAKHRNDYRSELLLHNDYQLSEKINIKKKGKSEHRETKSIKAKNLPKFHATKATITAKRT